MSYISSLGFKNKMDLLGIDQENLLIAYDFVSGDRFRSGYLDSPGWATGSVFSGRIRGGKDFYKRSGSGFFNGATSIEISGRIPDNDFTFLFCYEKVRYGGEVLLSSAAGSDFSSSSGLSVGINDANKLYLEYWSPVYGRHALDYEKDISSKNLIFFNKQFGEFNLGVFDPVESSLSFASCSIDSLKYKHSDTFKIGASSSAYWSSHPGIKSFSGFFDDFYCLSGACQYSDLAGLFSGFYSISDSGVLSGVSRSCFETTILSGSGVNLGTGITGYDTLINYTTGYVPSGCFNSGYSYLVGTGITGYYDKYIGSPIGFNGVASPVYIRTALTGEIYTSGSTYVCTGSGLTVAPVYTTIPLTGVLTGTTFVSVPSTACYETTGYYPMETETDFGFISSLGFNGVYSFEGCANISHCESYFYTGQPYFNINLIPVFNNVLNDYIISGSNSGSAKNLFFNNGQLMFDSGGSAYLDLGIEKYNITGNVFLDGNILRSNGYAGSLDTVIYDNSNNISGQSVYLTGGFPAYSDFNGLFSINYPDYSIFLNGVKLLSGLDFSAAGFSFEIPASSVLTKINNNYISSGKKYISGSLGYFELSGGECFANNCSQLYVNGLRQRVDSDYVEISKWSLFSGCTSTESTLNQLVYSSYEDFWNI